MKKGGSFCSAVAFGPFRFEPGNGLWRGDDEVAAAAARARRARRRCSRSPATVVSKQALLDAVVEGHVRHRSVAARGDPRAARSARRRSPQPDLHPDRPSPRLPLHRAGAAPSHSRPVHRRPAGTSGTSSRRALAAPREPAEAVEPSDLALAAPMAPADRRRRRGGRRHGRHRDRLRAASASARRSRARRCASRSRCRRTRRSIRCAARSPCRPTARAWCTSRCTSGRPRLFLRTIDRDAPEPIDGSDGAADPFFSPDGEWIGFFAHGSLKKLRDRRRHAGRALRGARRRGRELGARRHDRLWRRSRRRPRARLRAKAASRSCSPRRRAGRARSRYGWPDVLPDGRAVLYTAVESRRTAASRVLDLTTRTSVTRSSKRPRSAATRRPVISCSSAAAVSRRRRSRCASWRLTAAPRPILRGLATAARRSPARASRFREPDRWSTCPARRPTSTSGCIGSTCAAGSSPCRCRRRRSARRRRARSASARDDGRKRQRAAISGSAISRRGALSRLSPTDTASSPTWRPDGLEIAFAYSKAGPFNLFVRPDRRRRRAAAAAREPVESVPDVVVA